MRPSSSRSRKPPSAKVPWLAAGALLASLAHASTAAAQACCASGASLAPARLEPNEDAIVGLAVKASYLHGSFDAQRRYLAAPAGTVEIGLEQDLVAAIRVLDRGQLAMVLPMVETVRRVPGAAEGGGDLGDLQLSARWDFTLAGRAKIPGIALALGLTAPTGRPLDAARKPLATDATGGGAAAVTGALSLEQMFGAWVVNLTGSATWRGPHAVGEAREQQGLELSASAAAGRVFDHHGLLALTLAHTGRLAPTLDGAVVPGAGRASTRAGLAGGLLLGAVRLQSTLYADLPIRALGLGQPAALGLSIVLIRSFS